MKLVIELSDNDFLKASDTLQKLADLLKTNINNVETTKKVEAVKEVDSKPAETVVQQQPQTEPKQEYTADMIQAAVSRKAETVRPQNIKELLKKYGAGRLSELQQSDYAAFMADLERLV